MKEIKYDHYVETTIHIADLIIKNLKTALKSNITKLDLGITGEQFLVLDTIYSTEDIYQQKLSELLMKDKSNTTRILKILSDKGLITRKLTRINNRPVYLLNISSKGKELVDINLPKIKKYLTDTFQNLTDEDVELLREISKKINKDLAQIAEK